MNFKKKLHPTNTAFANALIPQGSEAVMLVLFYYFRVFAMFRQQLRTQLAPSRHRLGTDYTWIRHGLGMYMTMCNNAR